MAANARNTLIRRLQMATPSHPWDGASRQSGNCQSCPTNSPFRTDRAAHVFVIEERLNFSDTP